jgi:predicted neutral ceramidase superfamily lipid hydrolase
MPDYLKNIEVWESIWPLFLAIFLFSGVLVLITVRGKQRGEALLVVMAFCALGISTGYLTGFSRTAVLGAVLPAVLSLMGGLLIYMVGSNPASRGIVSLCTISFCFMLILGSTWGAVMRGTAERYRESAEFLIQQAFIESEVRDFRQALGLSELVKPAK